MEALLSTWLRFLATTTLLLTGPAVGAGEDGGSRLDADDNSAVWRQPAGDWYVAGDAMVDPDNPKALIGNPDPQESGARPWLAAQQDRHLRILSRRPACADVFALR